MFEFKGREGDASVGEWCLRSEVKILEAELWLFGGRLASSYNSGCACLYVDPGSY